MTLTVLTDNQIRALLEDLTAPELESFRVALAKALHKYSTGVPGETSIHQPERVSVHSTTTGATTLFMPSCSSAGNGVKVITLTSPFITTTTTPNNPPKPPIPPTGAITLFTPSGTPLGILHASTLTAFRTALASLCLIRQRTAPLTTLLIFGCGEQAYWHVRLTLLLRGAEVKRVVFVNRRVSPSSQKIRQRFEGHERREKEGWGGCEFEVITRGEKGFEGRLEEGLREADVVVCCTPATEALFGAGVCDGDEKGRLVVAIGSYTPAMREVPAGLISRAVSGKGEGEAGVVVVDTIEGALNEAGELIELGLKREQMVELGELIAPEGAENTKSQKLRRWLETGNVIYKSVGLGLMDLSIGMHTIEFAKEKGVGTHVEGF